MQRLSIRARSTLIAAAIVGVSLLIGSIAMIWVLRSTLQDNLDMTLQQQATETAISLGAGATPAELVGGQSDEAFVWIGTSTGELLAVGGSLVPVESPIALAGQGVQTIDLIVEEFHQGKSAAEIERERLRVASASAPDGTVVLVASELESVTRPVAAVSSALLIGVPLVVALAAAVAWLNTGRALRPVEEIRSRASQISGSTLSDRVPVPAATDEIHHLAETMNSMLERIEHHSDSMRQFTADASHELKSPIANIRAIVDTADLAADPTASKARLAHEADRLGNLVENLLYLAASDEGRAPRMNRTSVNLDDLIFDEAEILASAGAIRIDIDGVEPVVIEADREMLRRVIRNLGENALRHARSTVWIGVSEVGDNIAVLVSDDGDGVAPVDQRRIFERFTRLDAARDRQSGGSGLGLSIVQSIAAAHGGSISVQERGGGGAAFTLMLPAASQ